MNEYENLLNEEIEDYLIKDDYLIKRININIINTYKVLKHYNIKTNYPIYANDKYFVFKMENKIGEEKALLLKYIEDIKYNHKTISYEYLLDDRSLKYFSNIFKVLDSRFKSLEYSIRYLENTPIKGDYNWVYLSKYHIILDAKKRMLHLEDNMIKEIKKKNAVKYSICHGYLSVNNYSKGINYYFNSYLGILSSDIVRFYLLNNHIDIDWKKVLNDWFKELKEPIYKIYFEFMALYIYIINLNSNLSINYESVFGYIKITKEIKRIINIMKE